MCSPLTIYNTGNYMMAVTVHDHINSPAVFGPTTYLFLMISDVKIDFRKYEFRQKIRSHSWRSVFSFFIK